ncbi:MAG: hydrogenase expression/formation protein HypE [Dehalococcoidia bacterium]
MTIFPECPLPLDEYPRVLLAHGGGGRLTQNLIERVLLPSFDNPYLAPLHDGALLDIGGQRLALSTDSYVVQPLFFPGGDIGRLAVFGTANDLAMCGARPLFLSCGLIIEEGFAMADLWRVVVSLKEAANEAGVQIVTGDSKVVERGKGDGVFINTAGIGVVLAGLDVGPQRVRPGDEIVLSGSLGRHGIAIMALREGLDLDVAIESDSAPLFPMVEALAAEGIDIHMLRDPTRGGVSSALNEIAKKSGTGIVIEEKRIAVGPGVQGVCEILGLDPLYVANEGNFLAFVAADEGERAVQVLRRQPCGREAAVIGRAVAEHGGTVVMRTQIGGERIVDVMSGEQLPRIC